MGIEVAVLATVAVAAEAGKMNEESQAASAQEAALDLQSKEQQVQYQQKTLSNYDVMQKVLDAQTAQMTVSGAAFSSPSFNAIQRDSINTSAKQQANTDTEEDMIQNNINNEKSNVKSKLYADLFGDVSNLAMTGFSLYKGMPSKGA